MKIPSNILNTYSDSTIEDIEKGETWYEEARFFCEDLGKQYGYSIETVIGVLAALSPRNKWEHNKQDTYDLIAATKLGKTCKVHTFNLNKVKAVSIIKGGDPLNILGGNKVRSFYHNILMPDDEAIVTIDGHAFCIWKGKRIVDVVVSNRDYKSATEEYIETARHVGVKPSALQAITWNAYKRIHNI